MQYAITPAHAWLHSVGPVRRLRASHSITQVIYLASLSHKLVKHVTTLCLVNYLPDFEIFPVYAAVKEGYLNLGEKINVTLIPSAEVIPRHGGDEVCRCVV